MKIAFVKVAAVASLALAASVSFAQTGEFGTTTSGSSITVETAAGTGANQCDVLQSNVVIGTSQRVLAAYDCRVPGLSGAGLTTPAAIGVGTCHVAGLVKARTFNCTSATAPGGSANATCADDGAGNISGQYTATGAGVFFASSIGGAVNAVATPVCDTTATVLGVVSAETTNSVTLATQ